MNKQGESSAVTQTWFIVLERVDNDPDTDGEVGTFKTMGEAKNWIVQCEKEAKGLDYLSYHVLEVESEHK